MFYSHTILARKGPLATVWCAAHLQHRLKKSHYTSTNIPSTVERIMYPECPIALRMSGHLLLGVVRIYAKQVDYLYHDCNGVITDVRKAFSSISINLPEGATEAPFHSVTLPERFELDALELDDDYLLGRYEDNHLKSLEEITLEDQIPTGTEPYIIITFDEEIRSGSPVQEDASGSRAQLMEEDVLPSNPEDTTAVMGDPSSSHQAEVNVPEPIGGTATEVLPDAEIMRDALNDFHMEDAPIWPGNENDIMEPDRVLEEQIIRDNEAKSPAFEEMLPSGGPSIPAYQAEEPLSVASERTDASFDLHIGLGHATPELALRATPEVVLQATPVEQPRAKQRKRKRQFFDESTVLTNKYMKKALEDSHGLLRKKRNCPASNLDIWKLKRLKKDSMFREPLITGLSSDLLSVYDREVISSKSHLVNLEETHPEPEVMQNLEETHPYPEVMQDLEETHPEPEVRSPTSRSPIEVEIEHLRDFEGSTVGIPISENLPSPNRFVSSPVLSMPSEIRRDEATPSTINFGSDMDRFQTTIGTDVHPTPDMAASSGLFGSDIETSATIPRDAQVEDSILSDVPEMANSAGELSFLEQDDNTPAGSPQSGYQTRKNLETQEFDKLSARTRAVAQFLKRQSSVTPNLEDSGTLSLNAILEGKTRKICARMFNEILVLKNCGLVDVNQEEPFDDITLKVTSKLSKEPLSS